MDLRRQIALFRSWLPFLVAGTVLAALGAFAFSSLQPRVYDASSTLIVGQSLSGVSPEYEQLLVSQRLSTTYAKIATKRPVLEAVIAELDLDTTPGQLATRVRADAAVESTLLTITVQDGDAETAAAIANEMARQLIAASAAIEGDESEFEKSVQADLAATQRQITTTQAEVERLLKIKRRTVPQQTSLEALEERLATLRAAYVGLLSYVSTGSPNRLSVVEPAEAPTSPAGPRTVLNTLLAAVIGLLLVLGVLAVREYLDDRVKTREDVEEVLGIATLGLVGKLRADRGRGEKGRLASLLHPRSAEAEAYRTLRTNIEFSAVDAPVNTLLVTSSSPGEGKTITAANLAVTFAQTGRRVLLVDADLRKPGIHAVFALPNDSGLTSLLRNERLALDAAIQPTEQANLRVLTSGPVPPNPAELLGSQRMRAVLDRFRTSGELMIFDSPPLQAVTDAAILSSFLDATLLVVDTSRSRRGAVRAGMEALTKAGANVLGAALNRSSERTATSARDSADPDTAEVRQPAHDRPGVGA